MNIACLSSPVEAQMDVEAVMMQMEKFLDNFPLEAPTPPSVVEFPFGVPPPPLTGTLSATPPMPVSTPLSTVPLEGTAVQDLAAIPPLRPHSYVQGKPACGTHPLCARQTPTATMREMVFRIAAMQPVHIDPEAIRPPKRRNVRISKDPQSVAARHRRERISERIRILQRLVPGGTKMDTASMLDEAIHYVKFLKTQVQSLEKVSAGRSTGAGLGCGLGLPLPPAAAVPGGGFSCSSASRRP